MDLFPKERLGWVKTNNNDGLLSHSIGISFLRLYGDNMKSLK